MDQITVPAWEQLRSHQRLQVHDLLEDATSFLTQELFEHPRHLSEDPEPQTAYEHRLGRVAAMTALVHRLQNEIKGEVYSIAGIEKLKPNYADLGRATGLTREGAHSRYHGVFTMFVRPKGGQ